MQLFVRHLDGVSHAYTASSPSDLIAQVTADLNLGLSSSRPRLSYASRTLSSSSDSFTHIPPYATLDVSFSLRGGGPKKRCAHVFVKTGSSPSGSGVNTPKQVEGNQGESDSNNVSQKKDGEDVQMTSADKGEKEGETITPPPLLPAEPTLERCSSAALRMIGECPRCDKSFCGAHRLPEDHACPALANFRKAAFDENRAKLEKEATVSSKISAF